MPLSFLTFILLFLYVYAYPFFLSFHLLLSFIHTHTGRNSGKQSYWYKIYCLGVLIAWVLKMDHY
jgi:hypothetical protein